MACGIFFIVWYESPRLFAAFACFGFKLEVFAKNPQWLDDAHLIFDVKFPADK